MERFSTHIGIAVVFCAVVITLALTASRLGGGFSDGAHAEPVLSTNQAPVVTNIAEKGDLAALNMLAARLSGFSESNCMTQGTTTVCKATSAAQHMTRID
ncbi:hypothetical protein [Breoghania sp.]|uniref:hypothetical protein n=1 Tax=Breoghania sp. TaxID=2065378 RepID=UPI0026067BE5|nr:hypothetical protein [Breoghania sp.]MDJ0931045.1 hypothetical protein [Breoghania sp.]